MSTLHDERVKVWQARGAGITYDAVREILADHASVTDSFGRTMERLRDLAFHAAETLAKDRVAALLDAEQENTALRAEVERLRGINVVIVLRSDGLEFAAAQERAAVVAWLRDCALDPETTGAEMRLFQNLATTIERGEHRREETK